MAYEKIKLQERLLKYGILLMSVSFIAAGVYRNEVRVVLKKAINICLECIGIG
ncbi:CD1871A family CXXC motif-containing protein [Clostridium sp. ZS2-4]|uniref:CD1871A family CXXC motif-containing protein n=1 Tax=Clostridium sp. ZS2-4 TaxID=2987703 RepID=UPI00227AE4DE|nr:CD1871A family CXXC motif-containing protein [Clostridium sp. ZS2-4]MCY6355688.1 CD1871A family CXXC motif-containing protein [Clostridium sp. ZS2-4]